MATGRGSAAWRIIRHIARILLAYGVALFASVSILPLVGFVADTFSP